MLSTEQTYLGNLVVIVSIFVKRLRAAVGTRSQIMAADDINAIFSGIDVILSTNQEVCVCVCVGCVCVGCVFVFVTDDGQCCQAWFSLAQISSFRSIPYELSRFTRRYRLGWRHGTTTQSYRMSFLTWFVDTKCVCFGAWGVCWFWFATIPF